MPPTPKTLLAISHAYPPDPGAVGMHLADACSELVRRGHRVIVLTSDRGYDDPSQRYPAREVLGGVEVRRVALSSFGKASLAVRMAGGLSLVAQATLFGVTLGRVDGVLATTSPPVCALVPLLLGALRGVPFAYWVMDINPDQSVVLGRVSETAVVVRLFELLNRQALEHASLVVTLDEFMAARLRRKREIVDKLEILPPWPHDNHLQTVAHRDNPFRVEHQLQGKFVVMYSGNHGPSSPITTVLQAAERLRHRTDIVFVFIGGGISKADVDRAIAEGASNVRSLPYQAMERLKYSLSAADVHVVTVGDDIVGIVHPSKVYGAMSIGRPILLCGPERCHAAPLVEPHRAGVRVDNGDVEGAVRAIETLASSSEEELRQMGQRARDVVKNEFSRALLLPRFVEAVEERLGLV